MDSLRKCRFLVLLFFAATLSACQTYAPEPLALADYGEGWKTRGVDITPAGEWMAPICESEGKNPDAPIDMGDGISLEEAEQILLRMNPDLRVTRAEAGVEIAKQDNAGLWDDPVLDALIGQKSPDNRDDAFIIGAGMTFTLPLSGRPEAQRAVAAANMDTALAQVLMKEWQLRQDLRLAWAHWSLQKEKRTVQEETLRCFEELDTRLALLVQAGEIQSTDVRGLTVDMLKCRMQLNTVEIELQRSENALYSFLGIHPGNSLALQAEIPSSAEELNDFSEESLQCLARLHPNVQILQAEYDATEKSLALEIRKQYPDIQLSPGYEDESDESRLSLGLGIPTAVWNRNRLGIATALAERNAARQRSEAGYESAYMAALDAHLAHDLAHSERAAIETELAPLLDKQLADLQTLLSLGEINILLLRQGLGDVLEAKMSWLAAKEQEAEAQITLDALFELSPETENMEECNP